MLGCVCCFFEKEVRLGPIKLIDARFGEDIFL
jgi:hypothetical protein